MRHIHFIVLATFVLVAALLMPTVSGAGLGDKLKKKVEKKAVDKAVDKAGEKLQGTEDKPAEEAGEGESTDAAGTGSTNSDQVSEVSTKFDFVPGDKVLLYDDFTQDELGEFPAQWKLNAGTVEVAEMKGERWLRLAGEYGRVRPKMAGLTSLPEFWTLEFDIFTSGTPEAAFIVQGISEGNSHAWRAVFLQYGGTTVTFQSGPINAQVVYEAAPTMEGRHHVMIMARKSGLKIYVDQQRMVNIPEITASLGVPTEVQIDLTAPSCKPMITNVRFAEGCRPPKDLLAEGKLVTYGIYFDSGSDVVKAESAPVLRQIAAYLEANAAVNLQITGHTDNQGEAAGNLDLSGRRGAAVARVLCDQFKLAAERFKADGMGDTQPISSNANPEGRAMNRRVEFTRL